MNEVNYNVVEDNIDIIKLRETLAKMRASAIGVDPDPEKIIIIPLNLMEGE